MAKDAKGHGSEARGAKSGGSAEQRGASTTHGSGSWKDAWMDKQAAGGANNPQNQPHSSWLSGGKIGQGSGPAPQFERIPDKQAAGALAQGHPKSAPPLNAWGQTPAYAKQARAQLRQAKAFKTFAKHGYGNG